jgi:hypothetical protein
MHLYINIFYILILIVGTCLTIAQGGDWLDFFVGHNYSQKNYDLPFNLSFVTGFSALIIVVGILTVSSSVLASSKSAEPYKTQAASPAALHVTTKHHIPRGSHKVAKLQSRSRR